VYSWLDSAPVLVNTIIAYSPQGEAIACEQGGRATLACCDLFANAGGDWVGAVAPQLGTLGNFAADPRFCDSTTGQLHLRSDSPCLPDQHPLRRACGMIGALGPGCIEGPSADLSLCKSANRPSVAVGENVVFTITLKNLGPTKATEITFGDPVPDALNFVSFASSRGAVSGSFCHVAELAPGDSVVGTLVATPITNPAPNERWCQNTAYIAERSTPDPNPANDTASAYVYLAGPTSSTETDLHLEFWSEAGHRAGLVRFVFILPQVEHEMDLSVFDAKGRCVAVLGRGTYRAGRHVIDWDQGALGRGTPRGIYFARLRTSTNSLTRKVLRAP
jgi:uncharacterized repeat protein (TIGR01451 family)